MLVAIATVLLIASIGWNVWLFLRVTNGDAIGTATVQQSLNPASIDSVNTLFQSRAATETNYKNSHFVDPSNPTVPVATPASIPTSTTTRVVDPAAPAS
ncbi:MAG: hypothetical protein JWM39_81 [Parcubacteria group bacterium]|nr:hypothetical protein [Parcubacteria group bacterium]